MRPIQCTSQQLDPSATGQSLKLNGEKRIEYMNVSLDKFRTSEEWKYGETQRIIIPKHTHPYSPCFSVSTCSGDSKTKFFSSRQESKVTSSEKTEKILHYDYSYLEVRKVWPIVKNFLSLNFPREIINPSIPFVDAFCSERPEAFILILSFSYSSLKQNHNNSVIKA